MKNRREHILDELLILRCREGSPEAFRMLVERWQEKLWRHAYRLTGREDAAWDVVQESWLAVTRGLRSLSDPTRFRSWAYTIVTRTAADLQRRKGREEDVLSEEPMVDGLDEIDPDSGPSNSDSPVALLREALRKLPQSARVVLSLHYLEEFSLAEMAEVLDLPEGTVKSRLYHAREKLRELIERSER
jgi:RNA polymerase sigma-70 factor (ECF subfamily)